MQEDVGPMSAILFKLHFKLQQQSEATLAFSRVLKMTVGF